MFGARKKELHELERKVSELEGRLTDLSMRTGWGYSAIVQPQVPNKAHIGISTYVVSTYIQTPKLRSISVTEMLQALLNKLLLEPVVPWSGQISLRRTRKIKK